MVPEYDCLLVRVESETREKIGGLYIPQGRFVTNVDGPPVQAQTVGYVVATPQHLYECSHIVPEVEVGDKVHVHFNAINGDSAMTVKHGDTTLYLIPYSMIFCAVRNGKIIMIGGRVLCEAIYESDEVKDGKRVATTKRKGIIIPNKHSLFKARLSHIGTPCVGDPTLPCKSGDVVYYEVDSDFENEIEGKKYFVMRQENLIAYENN